ncbi:MAG: undecaprenyldiphospho-muramoylpentapeptide beta-N-acetylglucosaminyltransferase [Gammaproteobacteria bacterium]|nr:undecaprenyldiphospho-muramoylpentapeptide beta-N-acetylglucosaminyltransferase [Gammaproteobacteria bacterium]
MAGGTGGHVFPGLAVAAALRERERDVVWLGTHRGLEARVVPQHGIDIEWISIAGLRGKGLGAALAAPFRISRAIVQVLGAMRRRRPSAVLGMGGFVSGPGGIAAWLSRRPLVIHEQNAVAGTTNRWLARFASRVFEAFPGSFPAGVEAECVGNPVRRSIAALTPASQRIASSAARRPRLLVLGGSQGARVLNDVVPAALARLAPDARPEVLHQSGREHERAVARYREAGVDARIEAFIDDMAGAYGWADFAVARSGALTVSELAAAGLGAALVPYPHAIDDHQRRNAEQFAARGAGIVLDERDLSADALAAALEPLLRDPTRLSAMSEGAASFARADAAERLADACIALAEGAA